MSHPNGQPEIRFDVRHSFDKVRAAIGVKGIDFKSTTGEKIHADQTFTRDRLTQTIRFRSDKGVNVYVCKVCWGFRVNCSGTRAGQYIEGIDSHLP